MEPVASENSPYHHELDIDGSYKEIIVERHGGLMVVKFNRVASRNSFNRRTYYEIIRVVRTANYEDDIKIVVFTGVGDAFCAGNDLRDTFADARSIKQVVETQGEATAELVRLRLNDHMNAIIRLFARTLILSKKLLVALVNGVCVGIGLTLAALCDVVYCTEGAYFEAPFVRLGICPEMCSTYLMEQLIGRSKATELLIFGSRMRAEEALQLRFVAHIYKTAELAEEFWPQMQKYSELPKRSLTTSKYLMRQAQREDLMLALVSEIREMRRLRLSKPHMAAIEAFLNKNKKHSDNSSKL